MWSNKANIIIVNVKYLTAKNKIGPLFHGCFGFSKIYCSQVSGMICGSAAEPIITVYENFLTIKITIFIALHCNNLQDFKFRLDCNLYVLLISGLGREWGS